MKNYLIIPLLFVASAVSFAQSNNKVQAKYVRNVQLVKSKDPLAWKIKKRTWSADDEKRYSEFVVAIATAFESKQCIDIDSCLRSNANIYKNAADSSIKFFPVDCARNPYLLRAYFAWKNFLPFSYAASIAPRDPNDPRINESGLHYTKLGNKVLTRSDVIAPDENKFPSFASLQTKLMSSIYTATLRMPSKQLPDEPINDFYTVALTRDQVRPGTIIYYPEGHASTVFRISPNGAIRTFDAHPGNYLSTKPFAQEFAVRYSVQEWGGVLKNFRPVELVGGFPDINGNIIGGRIVLKTDAEIAGVDYFQNNIRLLFPTKSEYMVYLEQKLATSIQARDIVADFKTSLDQVCSYVQSRTKVVDAAILAGKDLAPKREKLPSNIIAGDGDDNGDWAEYATFGREINTKLFFKTALEDIQLAVKRIRNGDPGITYSNPDGDMLQDLADVYRSKSVSCKVSYVSRDGTKQSLNLEQVRMRLFLLSSDMQMCSDLRWGNRERGSILCQQDMRSFEAQQYLRNMTDRQVIGTTNAALTIDQLEIENQKNNQPVQWDTDFVGFFNKVANEDGLVLQ